MFVSRIVFLLGVMLGLPAAGRQVFEREHFLPQAALWQPNVHSVKLFFGEFWWVTIVKLFFGEKLVEKQTLIALAF